MILCQERTLRMNKTSEQRVNIINKNRRKLLTQFFTLALTLVSSMVLITSLSQAANAQLSASQQQALNSLIKTGFTNSYPINPPRTWCIGCPNISIPYSINLGQLLAMVPDQPRTSLDIILAPTQHQIKYGIFTIQIPRWALDSKNPSGADIPFKLTMDGHGLPWTELNATKTDRVLGLYFSGDDSFLQIYGNQGAVTKAFPTNH
jgi:hypothetical protein